MRRVVGSLLLVVGCGGRVEDVSVDAAPDATVDTSDAATADTSIDVAPETVDSTLPDSAVAEAADAERDPFVWARVLGQPGTLGRGPDAVIEPSGRTTFAVMSNAPFPGFSDPCVLGAGGAGVARLDPTGTPLFLRCYEKEFYQGGTLAVAPDGAVWLGTYDARVGSADMAVTLRRLDAKGALAWERTLRPKTPSVHTNVRGVVTTAAGEGIVAVHLVEPIDFGGGLVGGPGMPAVVAKYDATGALLWTRTIANESLRRGYNTALGATKTGGAVVVGAWFGGTIDLGAGPTSLTEGAYLLALNATGGPLWSRVLPYGADCTSVAANDKGEVVTAGNTSVPFDPGIGGAILGTKDAVMAFVVVYDPTGKPLWATSWPGVANVATFAGSTVWVGGAQRSSTGLDSPRLTHFAADGTTLGEAWPGYVTPPSRATVQGLSVDPTGGVAIVGFFNSPLSFGKTTLTPLPVAETSWPSSTFAARWVP